MVTIRTGILPPVCLQVLAYPQISELLGLMAGDLATVYVQVHARDVGRRLEEQDAVDDVADLAGVAERGSLVAEVGVAFRRVYRRLDDAGGDGIDPDAA